MTIRLICIVVISGLLLFVGITRSHAQWTSCGVSICTEMGNQENVQMLAVTNGNQGSIIVWHDFRNGDPNIYAQYISKWGYCQWWKDGIPICTATGNQEMPRICSDGSGGAIIVWHDTRNGDSDIYAQRIDISGNRLWAEDGIPICVASSLQQNPRIAYNGEGEAIIVWEDNRNAASNDCDIYAQKILSNGSTQWTTNGVPICEAQKNQYKPEIVGLGTSYGAIIVWEDYRNGNYDIYGQSVLPDGTVGWVTHGPICVSAGNQRYPQIDNDGMGLSIVTWQDEREAATYKKDIYAALIRNNGTNDWEFAVCREVGDQERPSILIPYLDADYAVITWQDSRSGSYRIYAQKLSLWHDEEWGSRGKLVSGEDSNDPSRPVLASDKWDGAIIAWRANSATAPLIAAQRVKSNGDLLWGDYGRMLCAGSTYGLVQIVSDYQGSLFQSAGAIISWTDVRKGNSDVYATWINRDGEVATLLQNYSAEFEDDRVVINWVLSQVGTGAHFTVLRTEDLGISFAELPHTIEETGPAQFKFEDLTVEPGTTYQYRIEVQDEDGLKTLFETDPITIPAIQIELHQNQPNPFNPATTIRYFLPANGHVGLEVYDIAGRQIAVLVEGDQEKGFHSVVWKGRDDRGNPAASGIYIYRLRANKETLSKKMVLLR